MRVRASRDDGAWLRSPCTLPQSVPAAVVISALTHALDPRLLVALLLRSTNSGSGTKLGDPRP